MLLCRSLSAGQLKVLGSNPAEIEIMFNVFKIVVQKFIEKSNFLIYEHHFSNVANC